MKKILFAMLAAACVFAGCTKFADEKTPVIGTVSVPSISDVQFDDYSLSATVTAADGTAYYAYAILEGSDEVNPSNLLADNVSGAIVSATLNASKQTSVNILAENLDPNTVYTIYAIASNKQGGMSEVVSVTKTTSDSSIPALSDYDSEVDGSSMTLWIGFDEPVTLTGAGAVTAFFYAANSEPDEEGYYSPMYELNIDLETLVVDGSWVGVPIPEEKYQPGAYVFVTFTDGIVKNAVGLENVGYSRNILYNDGTGFQFAGIYERYAVEDFNLEIYDLGMDVATRSYELQPVEETPIIFSSWSKFNYLIAPDTTAFKKGFVLGVDELSYRYTYTEASGRQVSYNSTPYMNFALCSTYLDLTAAMAKLDEAPEFGATISLSIPADCIEDIWGNANAAYEAEDIFFCSYGYTLDDFCGSFKFTNKSYMTGKSVVDNVTIAPADYDWDESYGEDPGYDVELTGTIGGVPVRGASVCGWVDLDCGTLTIPNYSVVFEMEVSGQSYTYMDIVMFDYINQEAEDMVISHTDADTYTFDGYFGMYLYYLDENYEALGGAWYELLLSWNGVRNSGSVPITPITSLSKELATGNRIMRPAEAVSFDIKK